MTELKPCPFCGSTDIEVEGCVDYIVCRNCGCFGPDSKPYTFDAAIERWNTRAERTCTFSKRKDDKDPYPTCSACGYVTDWHECVWYFDNSFEYENNYCPNCGAKVVE